LGFRGVCGFEFSWLTWNAVRSVFGRFLGCLGLGARVSIEGSSLEFRFQDSSLTVLEHGPLGFWSLMRVCMCVCVCVCVCVHVFKCTYTYAPCLVSVSQYLQTYIHIYLCIYIYMYT